jgi:ubiquitin-like modifier-activating enzyme ATG7
MHSCSPSHLQVARSLLGWGVRHVTFVDNGTVSFSNPARQCLFDFSDSIARKSKALSAAEQLRKIVPNVCSEGHVLAIPMPGHPLAAVGHEEQDALLLDTLVRNHDVIFLLTDTRESRYVFLCYSCIFHTVFLVKQLIKFVLLLV